MNALLRLPRWLAGALLLFCIPAAAAPAIAYDCSTIQYWSTQYSMKDLRDMAKAHGYSEEDISKAEACLKAPKATAPTKRKQVAPPQTLHPEGNLEAGKRPTTLPPSSAATAAPVYTTPEVRAPVAVPAPLVVAPVPTIVVTEAKPAAEPKSSWAWDVLKYLGFIVLVGSALGIVVNAARRIRRDYVTSLKQG